MEKINEKKSEGTEPTKKTEGKPIRVSLAHHALLEKGREEINKDKKYKKSISFTRYMEKLIEDHWEKSIEDLKKERESSKDWLELEYKREAPDMSFYDWLKMGKEKEKSKKSAKRNKEG